MAGNRDIDGDIDFGDISTSEPVAHTIPRRVYEPRPCSQDSVEPFKDIAEIRVIQADCGARAELRQAVKEIP
jgi:hypothetical protein